MKAAILVNGVPASGKSTVARAVSRELGAPLMTLDTIKEPLFSHVGTGDREHNRMLGRASYEIIFAAIADWPDPVTVVVDAWFGFQPAAVLERHLAASGIGRTAEVWCHAPGEVLAERYGARVGTRSAGHPGTAYIPELIALNERATPIGFGACFDVDTTQPLPIEDLMDWLRATLAASGPEAA